MKSHGGATTESQTLPQYRVKPLSTQVGRSANGTRPPGLIQLKSPRLSPAKPGRLTSNLPNLSRTFQRTSHSFLIAVVGPGRRLGQWVTYPHTIRVTHVWCARLQRKIGGVASSYDCFNSATPLSLISYSPL